MEDRAGMEKPEIQALPRVQDRMTFIYLERCKINRDNGAISVRDEKGVTHIPAAAISVLLLGPGTDVTHRAMRGSRLSGLASMAYGTMPMAVP